MRTIRITSIAMAVCALAAPPVRGDVIDVPFPDVVEMSDSGMAVTGSVEVGLTVMGSYSMGGYTVSLEIVPQGGAIGNLTFTGATDVPGELIESTSGPILFNAGTFDVVTDVTDLGDPPVTVVDGGLFNLNYSIAPDTLGVFDVNFLFDPPTPPGSELQDGAALPLPTNFTSGKFTVFPEPATALYFAAGGGALLLRRRDGTARARR